MTITSTRRTFLNEFGEQSRVLVERTPEGATLTTTVDVIEAFDDGVRLVRRTVTSNGFAPRNGSESDVQLEVDLSVPGTPSPIEHAATNELLQRHIDALLAAAERFGYRGRGNPRAFLEQTRGHGCLPIAA